MTAAPTLRALIESWRGSDLEMSATMFAEALERTLQAHPVVPLGELQRLDDISTECMREWIRNLITEYSPQPPNQHPPGTYLWAREEHARGKRVRRNIDGNVRWAALFHAECVVAVVSQEYVWDSLYFRGCDFAATDWEVVK